jgi:hypothetical protein
MLADARQMLYVGVRLAQAEPWEHADVCLSEIVPVTATVAAAAAMFLPNLATWRDRPFIQQHCSSDELSCLEHDLRQLAESPSTEASITFGLRRLVLERRAG